MTRKEQIRYVKRIANDYGINPSEALLIFDILGESEMHDGFITMLEDYVEEANCFYSPLKEA